MGAGEGVVGRLWRGASILCACGSVLLVALLLWGGLMRPVPVGSIRGVERLTGLALPEGASLLGASYLYGWSPELLAVVAVPSPAVHSLAATATARGAEVANERLLHDYDNFPGTGALPVWHPDQDPVLMSIRYPATPPGPLVTIEVSPGRAILRCSTSSG